jgi:molecular chaperone HtpG
MSKHQFQAEVSHLLHLIVHSLYSHREVFVRELVSNASDALDKLKYLSMTDEAYKGIAFDPRIEITFDQKDHTTLTISDTGIGMNEEDLVANIGTIASSGTRRFLERMTGDARKDASLIGQFGVGFYSAFMVSSQVEVVTKKAGEDKAWRWVSDGKGEYVVQEAVRESHGTTVTCTLNDEGKEYANRWQIEGLVKKYSNHIPFPIYLGYDEESLGAGDKAQKTIERKTVQINAASAFWKRPKKDLKDADYAEFYKSLTGDEGDPLLTVHMQAEGALEYTTLLYVPAKAPWDLYRSDYQSGVKLYVKRVFISDDSRELMPAWLRFLQGVIDSEDLPLNVSREMLQQNRVMVNIRNASVKRVLNELGELSVKDPARYLQLYREYRRPLKEGVYQDSANREQLVELLRFQSSTQEGWTSFAEVKARMKPEQKAITYLTGDNEAGLRASPLLEVYRKKGLEVLLLSDEIDELVMPMIGKYKDTELKSANRAGSDEELRTEDDRTRAKEIQPLLDKIRKALGDSVKDVRASARLAESPSCIVADDADPTVKLQQIFRALGQEDLGRAQPILEINPMHEIVKKLQTVEDEAVIGDVGRLLFEQALLIEGVALPNPAEFALRLNRILARAL